MKVGVLNGQYVQRLGDERDHGRLDRRLGGWSRMSKGEHGKAGETGRGQAMWILGLRILTLAYEQWNGIDHLLF